MKRQVFPLPASVEGPGTRLPPPEPAVAPDFVFDAAAKPVRFVWKIDPEGRFSELSPDFATAVGPNAADIVDRHFRDVAKVFGFDRDNQISDLLQRRDTWSGKTVPWPVQGTSLSVPVDLAALPIYNREREFEGFRGFGIVRIADAHEDPEAIGLSLADAAARAGKRSRPKRCRPTMQAPRRKPASRGRDEALHPGGNPGRRRRAAGGRAGAAAADTEDDPFRGETPALRIVRPFGRRENDKVIDLDQRRPRSREVAFLRRAAGVPRDRRAPGEELRQEAGRRGDTGTAEGDRADASARTPATAAPDERGPGSRIEGSRTRRRTQDRRRAGRRECPQPKAQTGTRPNRDDADRPETDGTGGGRGRRLVRRLRRNSPPPSRRRAHRPPRHGFRRISSTIFRLPCSFMTGTPSTMPMPNSSN